MKLVKAYLHGVNCNFESKNWFTPELQAEFMKGELFPICPEAIGLLGGSAGTC